jgi:hypothetical protein
VRAYWLVTAPPKKYISMTTLPYYSTSRYFVRSAAILLPPPSTGFFVRAITFSSMTSARSTAYWAD